MQEILDAIQAEQFDALAGVAVPDHYRGVTVHADEVDMFAGIPSAEKDPRKSLHVDEVATPELGPGEAIVAVMASAINYNTVWTSIFEPLPTFGFLAPLRPHLAAHRAPRPALPRRRVGPRGRRAAHRGRASTPGSPATGWWRTASRWSWRAPTATATR